MMAPTPSPSPKLTYLKKKTRRKRETEEPKSKRKTYNKQLKKEKDTRGTFLTFFQNAGCTSNYVDAPSITQNSIQLCCLHHAEPDLFSCLVRLFLY